MTAVAVKVARVVTISGRHRRDLRSSAAVTQHTQSTHIGPHHHGWSEEADCPRCYPAAYAKDHAKHRTPGVAQ